MESVMRATLRLRIPVVTVALVSASLFMAAGAASVRAQKQPTSQATANWALANRFRTEALRPVIHSQNVPARWIGKTDSLWYSWEESNGTRYMLVVPKTKTKRPLFDHTNFAAELSRESHKAYEPGRLPTVTFNFDDDGQSFWFLLDSVKYNYQMKTGELKSEGKQTKKQIQEDQRMLRRGAGDWRAYSPDSTAFAFAREHNLYFVEMKSRLDTLSQADTLKISSDGVKDYSFGARDTTAQQQQQQQDDEEDGEGGGGRGRSRDNRVRANVNWSPDSRAFTVIRNDSRKVGELYLVNSLAQPRPKLVTYKYAMPGEANVDQQELWLYRRGSTQITPVDVKRWKDQRLFNVHWTTGSDRVRLVRRDRLQRNIEMIEINLADGKTTQLLHDEVENNSLERQNVMYTKRGGDFVWWSERSGWGHLYLYGFNGEPKGQLTKGAWRVDQLVDVDTLTGKIWFRGVAREGSENPYYRHLYSINADGTGLTLLDAGDADHNSSLSPSKRYELDNYSRVDMPTKSVVRDHNGKVILDLEQFDDSGLRAMGWKAPERFVVKAADGTTDIFGVMWKPFDFDSTKTYPIIAHVYPGPQTESVTASFTPNNANQQLAQLGFIVVQIGNRGGSPQRSNAYQGFGYYNLRDYALADKKAGIEQLAAVHHWIDIDRVGIYGHSGGGFLTAAALMLPPYNSFFKVGVSSSGNHDNNVYNQNWSEQYHGLKEVPVKLSARDTAGKTDAQKDSMRFEIKVPTNAELAKNLKGNLLLVHGDMDNNVHYAGTVRLMDALIKANKRFDFMLMPGQAHGYAPAYQAYFMRRLQEYFVEHLIGEYRENAADVENR
jgi:dipeptidyl aminopeptidase/acylaminoacyl peptidase